MGLSNRRRMAAVGCMCSAALIALPAAAGAEVTLAPSSGTPGSTVVARGSADGSGACRSVEIRFGATQHSDGHVVDAGTSVAQGTCDESGRYSVGFVVPADAPAGPTQVLVVARDGAGTTVSEESAPFTVKRSP